MRDSWLIGLCYVVAREYYFLSVSVVDSANAPHNKTPPATTKTTENNLSLG